ncbi:MAG: glycosyltransferase family 2 protein [Planctomycetes bacterium]|nr:glycosyltransferase family 2 protein [Planctomycetota bacterium]
MSIVIPSHCRPDLLRACLASVTRLAPPGTEVIVVDDGSADARISRTAEAFAGVRVLRLSRPRGFCGAANAGIQAVQGTVVELLNDDTEVAAGWAEAALEWFRDPNVGAVAPLVLYRSESPNAPARVDSAGDRYYVGGIAGKRGHGEPLQPEYLHPCRVFGASGSSAFYRREALMRVGGFPEHFGAYFEDVDLAFRLHRAGYHIMYEPAARVYHHVSASHGRPGRRLLEQQSLNEERVFWRNLPGPALMRALPRHLLVLAAKAWRRWQEGTLAPYCWGRLRLLGEVPELARHRREWQRRASNADLRTWQVEPRFWGERGV